MNVVVKIKETKRGDVEVQVFYQDFKGATNKESIYAQSINRLIGLGVPHISKALGSSAVIDLGNSKE